jgi:hypothetical protein
LGGVLVLLALGYCGGSGGRGNDFEAELVKDLLVSMTYKE